MELQALPLCCREEAAPAKCESGENAFSEAAGNRPAARFKPKPADWRIGSMCRFKNSIIRAIAAVSS
jgi:hypothetical protein